MVPLSDLPIETPPLPSVSVFVALAALVVPPQPEIATTALSAVVVQKTFERLMRRARG